VFFSLRIGVAFGHLCAPFSVGCRTFSYRMPPNEVPRILEDSIHPTSQKGISPKLAFRFTGSRKSGRFRQAQLFEQVSRIQLLNKTSLSKSGFVVLTNGLLQFGKFGGV
jgi:hypothetical protein